MTEVAPIKTPSLEGKRLSFALAEDRLAHYPEFRDFFVRTFDLDRKGLSEPGYVRAPSGNAYALIFIGRSGTPFPSGLEIHAIVDAIEPIDGDVLDRDLWSILRWMIDGVGVPWTVEDFDRTGRLYRVPAAPSG
ncbi:hypothetical protein [Bradyrhizobium erythrophlei]|jgi:hypothetical protein|uniref:Uncharacterized protein n=1 Tax=Bradyrhizobium erythrophlei TaxID=1437360 RepID=A0A1M7UQP9_9BRAD|nr:hypothetical protein [Bradyrhizobium erythrophlei]SHN85270.1 hypothetical protein SAMN05444170_6228 [Bradyrhizobium erythrophlei]